MTLPRLIAAAAVVAVLGIVAAALVAIGPPNRARLEALDRQRISDLGDVAAELHNRYINDRLTLPATLPQDRTEPVTGSPYEYRRANDFSYALCARFALATPASTYDRNVTAFWRHSAGRFCYRFDVRQPVESTL